MPEGDTLFRAARSLDAVLAGRRVFAFRSSLGERVDDGRVGKAIERVRSRGKNLFVVFEDGFSLHVHLGMQGAFRIATREAPRPLPRDAALLLEVDDGTRVVCVTPSRLALLRGDEARQASPFGTAPLEPGPDLLAATFSTETALPGFRARATDPIGDVLMMQHVVAGIGNVYKSEVLFLEKVWPFKLVAELDDAAIGRVLIRARDLLRRNALAASGVRVTRARDGGRHWVYRRSGKPCFTCGHGIAMKRQANGRSTYFCSACQRP